MLDFEGFEYQIEKYAKENNISKKDVYDLISIPSASKIAILNKYPKTSTIDKWCRIFNCEIKDLVSFLPNTEENLLLQKEKQEFVEREKSFAPLKEIIDRKNLTIYRVCKELGIKECTVHKILFSNSTRYKTLVPIAAFLGVKVRDLYTFCD